MCRRNNEQHNDRALDEHDHVVDVGRLFDSDDEQRGDDGDDDRCGQVEDRGHLCSVVTGDQRSAGRGQCAGKVDAEVVQQRHEVSRPANGNGHRAECVLQHEVPPDDPGDQLTERRVPVGVGAARHGHERCELRIAERRENRRDAGERE